MLVCVCGFDMVCGLQVPVLFMDWQRLRGGWYLVGVGMNVVDIC